MSFIVSARKWRPQIFDEIIGQHHIVTSLKNAINSGRIANAYLFSGTRGVGKTTTARVFSKALNCSNGPTDKPCGTCNSCKDIKKCVSMDVIEIDGASNRGIDDIRALRENVRYAPASGTYKVYIIDEVHMLTKEAFNALLKTLEEPPKHVIFLFATTEINKVPDTILSRCQWFDFKSISLEDIVKQLSLIAQKDSISIKDDYLLLIAKNAEGSMRDAEMLLDQVISFCGKIVTEEKLQEVLGLIDKKVIEEIVNCIAAKDPQAMIQQMGRIRENAYDVRIFHKELASYVRNLMIAVICPEKITDLLNLSPSEEEILKRQAKLFTGDQIHRIFAIMGELDKELKYSSYPEIALEMGLIKISQLAPLIPVDSVLEKIDNAIKLYEHPGLVEKQHQPVEKDQEILTSPKPQEVTPSVVKESGGDLWRKIVDEVGKTKPLLPSVLECFQILSLDNDISLGINKNQTLYLNMLKKKDNLTSLAAAARKITGKDLVVNITLFAEVKNEKAEGKVSENNIEEDSGFGKEIISEALEIFKGNMLQ